jgi:regulatory protein
LSQGLAIKPELMKKIEEQSNFEMAISRSLVFLSYRKRSKKEVENKLRILKYNDAIIKRVIKRLIDNNYLCELDYAKAFAQDTINLKGYGKNHIYRALKYQNIDEESINLAISTISLEDEIKAAKKMASKKGILNPKLKETLYRRGFSREAIENIFKA